MSWIPHFTNYGRAAGAAAVAIPLLLLLYFLKLRRQERLVPSTLLWKKAIQDLQVNSPFQKLRRNLLLLLQLLLLLALLLAFARPIANYHHLSGKTNIILIDCSASMNAKDGTGGVTRLADAKRQAKALVDSMDRGATAMVIAFNDSAQTMQAMTGDPRLLKQAIDAIEPTDRATRIELAFELVDAQSPMAPQQMRSIETMPDVYVYTDNRIADASADSINVRGRVTYELMGDANSGNIAIVALNASRNYDRPNEVDTFARLANYGPDPVAAPVQLSVDGKVVPGSNGKSVEDTMLLPDRWDEATKLAYEAAHHLHRVESVEFKLDLPTAGIIQLEQMHKDGDVLAADDVARVVVPRPKNLSVLLVTEGNYYLESGLQSLSLGSRKVMSPDEYETRSQDKSQQNSLMGYDVIIFDRYQPKWEPEAGNFIFFNALPTDSRVTAAMTPAVNGSTPHPVLLSDVGVLDWKRDHPILRSLSLGKLYVLDGTLKLNVPLSIEVLVDGMKGPLIVLERQPKRTNLILAFDLMRSSWPWEPSFPAFLDQAMQYLAVGQDLEVKESFAPGAAIRIPHGDLLRGEEPIKSIELHGPGGTRDISVPAAGDFVLPPLNEVGLYTTDPPVPRYQKLAVNLLDDNESNILPVTGKKPGDIGTIDLHHQIKDRVELWWWLVAAGALPLLMIEWWVYTRRVHL